MKTQPATKLCMLIIDLKPKTKSLAISAVTLTNDSAAVNARKVNRFNRLTETICEQTNVCLLTTGICWPITSTDQIYISTAVGAKFLGATFVDIWDELTCLPLAKNWHQNWQRVFGRTTSEYSNLWTIPRCGPITWAKQEKWQIIEPG